MNAKNLDIKSLRLEGLAILIASVVVYFVALNGHALLFALLLLAPDVSMIGYLANKQIGAVVYNLGHMLIGPLFLAVIGWATSDVIWYQLSAIWFAHVGLDRLSGYGLKSEKGFKFTHLGKLK